MADGRGFSVIATYETSSDVNTAPEETPHVYDETIRISGPTANATDPSPRITQPPKKKNIFRWLLVFLGIPICAIMVMVAPIVLISVLGQKEKSIDECSSGPCQNGGTCVDMVNSYRCLCSDGYHGTNCQGISGCFSRPCRNGGTCVDVGNSHLCLCSAGFYGTNCEVKDHCCSQLCQNGSNCWHQNSICRNCESAFVNDSTYRLVGIKFNDGYAGRVEVYHDGVWGTVCDDGWDNTDAKVFCKSLGLPVSNASAVREAYFGQGSGVILLDDLDCTGWEPNIGSCSHRGWGNENCGHSEDAGVFCRGDTP